MEYLKVILKIFSTMRVLANKCTPYLIRKAIDLPFAYKIHYE